MQLSWNGMSSRDILSKIEILKWAIFCYTDPLIPYCEGHLDKSACGVPFSIHYDQFSLP